MSSDITAEHVSLPAPDNATPLARSPSPHALPAATGVPLRAALLDPRDDVATALQALPAGTTIVVASGQATHEIVTQEPIPAGHKFAVRALLAGQRIRKYGEFIGRLTAGVAPGSWVHVHNVVTCARRSGDDERAWRAQAAPAGGVRTAGSASAGAGGAPLFDTASGRLYWIDRGAPVLHAFDAHTGNEQQWSLPAAAHGAVLTRDGDILVATAAGAVLVDPGSAAVRSVDAAWLPALGAACADLKCDAHGRLWGAAGNAAPHATAGSLYVFGGGVAERQVLEGLLAPGGIAWNIDATTLYVVESGRALVHAYEFAVDTGTLGAARVFADLGAIPGIPAGATIDGEDHLWLVVDDAGCLMRFAPDGRVDRVVRVPAARPTACAFGGDDCRQLFVTTASERVAAARNRAEPMAGRVLVMDVGVAGLPPRRAPSMRATPDPSR